MGLKNWLRRSWEFLGGKLVRSLLTLAVSVALFNACQWDSKSNIRFVTVKSGEGMSKTLAPFVSELGIDYDTLDWDKKVEIFEYTRNLSNLNNVRQIEHIDKVIPRDTLYISPEAIKAIIEWRTPPPLKKINNGMDGDPDEDSLEWGNDEELENGEPFLLPTAEMLPQRWILSNLLWLTINPTNGEEIKNYSSLLDSYQSTVRELASLQQNEKLKETVGEFVPYVDMLDVWIKESRLRANAESRTGAVWYGQVKDDAIAAVSGWLEKSGVSKTYAPKNLPSDNLLYSILYMSYLENDVQKYLKTNNANVSDDDASLFAIAAYNMWINKWKTLYESSGKVDSWEKFAEYIVKKLMKLKNKGEVKKDSDYGADYFDYFDGKDFHGDKKEIFKKRWTYTHTLTNEKAYETIRYVEIIKGMKNQISQTHEDYDQIRISNVSLYRWIESWLSAKEHNKTIKQWSKGQSLIEKILLDNGYTLQTKQGNYYYNDEIRINSSIIKPYLIDEAFKNYTYRVETYSKSESKFLWSIVNNLIKNENFVKSLKELDIDPKKDDLKELSSVIRQYALEAIVRFNQERRFNWSETASDDVRIPEAKYFQKYGEIRERITSHVESQKQEQEEQVQESVNETIDVGNIYADKSLDKKGKSILRWATNFEVIPTYNHRLVDAERSNGTKEPTHIMIHGTEDPVGDPSTVKAHFFIDKSGKIHQNGTSRSTSSRGITYPKKIVALNHAGVGIAKYGFSRNGNASLTYSIIGIEVEILMDEDFNDAQLKSLETLVYGLSTSYKIPQSNILTHQQSAANNTLWRGRKSDGCQFDFEDIWMIDNYQLLDKDVISGKLSPNMYEQIKALKERKRTKAEIKKILSGLNTSILLCRKNPNAWKNRMNDFDVRAWSTLEELEKKGLF